MNKCNDAIYAWFKLLQLLLGHTWTPPTPHGTPLECCSDLASLVVLY